MLEFKEKYNSFMLCLYLNSFFVMAFLRSFTIKIQISVIVFLFSLVIGIYSIKLTIPFIISIFFIIFISGNLLWSLDCITSNALLWQYIKYLILIIMAMYFSNLKISIEYFVKYLKKFLLFSILVLVFLLINKNLYQKLNLNYMSFGYSCLTITLFAAYLFNISLKYKYLFMTLILNLILFLYGSRFTFILGILGSSVFLYFSSNKIIKRFYWIGSSFTIVILFNLKKVLELTIEILRKYNISTFSVERLYFTFFDIDSQYGIIGEREIWFSETLKLIKKSPIFGTGILGWINEIPVSLYNGNGVFYPHNLFLEILMHFGTIGLFVFSVIIFIIIKHIVTKKKQGYKIDKVYLVFVLLSFKLLLSNSYLSEIWFWFALLIPFNNSYYKKQMFSNEKLF